MSILNLERLKRRLRWNEITFSRDAYQFQGQEYYTCRFQVLPGEPKWPTIDLIFDEDLNSLQALGFSHWHAHYDRWSDSRRDLIEALRAVRGLLKGDLCLLEQLDADGKYRDGSLVTPEEIPGTLSGETLERGRNADEILGMVTEPCTPPNRRHALQFRITGIFLPLDSVPAPASGGGR